MFNWEKAISYIKYGSMEEWKYGSTVTTKSHTRCNIFGLWVNQEKHKMLTVKILCNWHEFKEIENSVKAAVSQKRNTAYIVIKVYVQELFKNCVEKPCY